MSYSDDNIFAKILRKEIPCEKVYEDDHCLAFKDINPQAKIHVLVVPKGKYISFDDFSQNASGEEISSFFKAVGKIAKDLDLSTEGYRILSNIGKLGGQEVPHFHIHIFGKQDLGPMLSENLG
ncbi:MAG TPA: histidine triad nucleotide-binding protein [Alphaproteobacteria bacterium]|nr:histidine triad nucleotide-binding protein [Rickettsiales bacterium]HAE75016.1 histidine triad nucleotide-binding protein [Alphaproteobacteria bacterium]|tara:strand:+ start:1153 stop:1521 length:369 start_codon:yes stop_codon:yes gene_type:complete